MNGNISETSGNIGRKSRTHSPKGASNSPKLSPHSPKNHNPKGGLASPKGGAASPKTGTSSPKNNGTSSKGNTPSPKSGGGAAVSPKVKSPKSSTPPSPRSSQLSPKSVQQKPRSRSQSPKGRPQSPKGSPGSQQKLKKLVDNNNHGGIYDALHVDVDLANNKLTVSPVAGRRCHSDSRISVTSSIQPSNNKKRKLEFTDIKTKRSSPPGKKRRSDSTGNSSAPFSSPKQGDRTVDHNQNIQVVGNGSGKRRNSWDSSLHSPDQYKSIHSIGSRKAVMKVATYSDTILTSTRRSLPACQPSITNGAVDKSGVQLAPMDLSMVSVKDHSSLSKQVKVKSPVSKPQRTGTVSSKPEIVVTGESETSSIESDPTDKYEKVDADILFKKGAIEIMEVQHMEQEINSTGDKVRSRSTPSSLVFEDASDKDKRSISPQSEGDDSAFSTDDAPSTEGEQNQAKGKKQRRLSKKYEDIQPRAPRKRRMASLTAETKNLLLFDKDLTAPLPPVKKSTGGEGRGRKRKREENQTLQSGESDGALLQTCNHIPKETSTVSVEQGVKDNVTSESKAPVSSPTEKSKADSAKNSRLSKDIKGARTKTGNLKSPTRTQSGNLKSPTSTAPKPAGNSKAKSNVSFAVAKKEKRKESTPCTTRSKSPSPSLVSSSSSSSSSKSVSSPVVSSSPGKLLLSSRHATVDTAETEKLTAITSTTSITTPLLLRMSRHSTDGTSSGDESLLPSPSGFDPLSISLLQPGKKYVNKPCT